MGAPQSILSVTLFSIKINSTNINRHIRSPILIESTIYVNLIKPCYPHPSRYWTHILIYDSRNTELTDNLIVPICRSKHKTG
jgi:hypothetical protein